MIVVDLYVVGNTLPLFEANWGEGGIDISGWVITLRVRKLDSTLLIKTATITDGAAGDFEFQFGTSDLVAGFQPAEVNFDTGSGNFTVRSLAIFVHGGV